MNADKLLRDLLVACDRAAAGGMFNSSDEALRAPMRAAENAARRYLAAGGTNTNASPDGVRDGVKPDGYAYEYPGPYGGIMFTNGEERNGSRPVRAVPYWLGTPPNGVMVGAPPKPQEQPADSLWDECAEAVGRLTSQVQGAKPREWGRMSDLDELMQLVDNAVHSPARCYTKAVRRAIRDAAAALAGGVSRPDDQTKALSGTDAALPTVQRLEEHSGETP